MKTYTEIEVVNILQHIENKGFNEDCLTMNEELKHLEEIGVVKNCHIQSVRQQSDLLKAFLKWRLDKPHSDFQTQDYDIEQFLKAYYSA
jgi:hypothetical protein